MTWALVGCVAAALGVIALLGAAALYEMKSVRSSVARTDRFVDELRTTEKTSFELKEKVAELEKLREDDGIAIEHLTDRVGNEIAARKKAEDHASAAISELAKTGSAPAAAERLRNDLERLRALSRQNVPDVPDPT